MCENILGCGRLCCDRSQVFAVMPHFEQQTTRALRCDLGGYACVSCSCRYTLPGSNRLVGATFGTRTERTAGSPTANAAQASARFACAVKLDERRSGGSAAWWDARLVAGTMRNR